MFTFSLPIKPGMKTSLGDLQGASISLAIYSAAQKSSQPLLLIVPDVATANQLERELQFFRGNENLTLLNFPDWETLPYDQFSPHPDIISDRLKAFDQLLQFSKGIVIVAVSTLIQRLAPREFLQGRHFSLKTGQQLIIQSFSDRLTSAGYHNVTQVMQHGEYAIRGSIIDVFPMGSSLPFRIDLLDDEIDSLRSFDVETQRTLEVVDSINMLPAHEFPLDADGISHFRQTWREKFTTNPLQSPLYQSVSQGQSPAGIEYYLSLFFDHTDSFFDYIKPQTLIALLGDIYPNASRFTQEINERYEQLRWDVERPILPPNQVFLSTEELFEQIGKFPQLQFQAELVEPKNNNHNFATQTPPELFTDPQSAQPLHRLKQWLDSHEERVLFVAESSGRREVLENLLAQLKLTPKFFPCWQDFLADQGRYGITVAALDRGMSLLEPPVAIIAESQLFGQQVMQRRMRMRKRPGQDAEFIVRDLTELKIGAAVVHIDHGVGRYLGLQTIKTGEREVEYLSLEYADNAKLYVPISSLHLISRYSAADVEHAPLHRLGSGQWDKVKRKASEKLRDVAAELLNIYAQRAATEGFSFAPPDHNYTAFAAAFPFETTPDQQQAIDQVIADMVSTRSMDRVVCGDVGFGKTEVAMRAAFMAVQSHKQVGVLVPTTLLAEQHLHSFQDRFAKWPIRVEAISRFRSAAEQNKIIEELAKGKIDIIIGTHKLLQENIKFKELGLLIVDEEHRFGVRQKERIKAMRANVDLLTLTATPIPRTLNMALASIRDLSIIATPPAKRLSVKTFVREYNKSLVREAVLREVLRGGQVYFLHNEVQTIERMAHELQEQLPEVRIGVAHGQMRESSLEQIMVDFYHQRFNVLLATTIIESGIDIPNANTIIMNRADRLGLAQLHQLRGRVGRSHHQAYAYLLIPPPDLITPDAKKRLEAIESLENLGAGFMLANYDLEIRGAGELLGEEQSGHIHEIGFSLYMELLEETLTALRAGKDPLLEKPLHQGTEIDLKVAALIPEDYLPDVHTRLMLYKRISNAKDTAQLDDLQVEMIDRFGLLPPAAKNLFRIAELKLQAQPLGIRKIDAGSNEGVLEFIPNPPINPVNLIQLIQKQPQRYKLLGNEKLRFNFSAETIDQKIKFINELIDKIKG